jgi:Ca2+-binding EF-hand superfamily protein
MADFKTVDVNSDNKVDLDEITKYLGVKTVAPMNQVQLSVTDESRSLFDVLDTREDRRLSPRELIAAASMLEKIDGNKDGRVTFSELTTRIAVTAKVKSPAPERNMMMMRMPANRPGPATVARDSGPDWFQRMDRNYDGDVSWKEFLGPRTAFDRYDKDKDGLLSADEVSPPKTEAAEADAAPAN